jgi:nucleoside-diphosphate-sugar epimerase
LLHPQLVDWQYDQKRFKYIWKSAGDSLSLIDSINDYDSIIYTAALADVPYYIQNPLDAVQVNVQNTTQFLELLREMTTIKCCWQAMEVINGREQVTTFFETYKNCCQVKACLSQLAIIFIIR